MTTTTVPEWTLTDRLYKARKVAGLTIDQLAARLEVSEKTVRRLESGEVVGKRTAVLGWAVACGVDPMWLLTGEVIADADTQAVTLCKQATDSTVLVAQLPGQLSLKVAA